MGANVVSRFAAPGETRRRVGERAFDWILRIVGENHPVLATYASNLAGVVKNYSPGTIDQADDYVHHFLAWCAERAVTRASEVTKPMIDRYQRSLFYHRRKNGQP